MFVWRLPGEMVATMQVMLIKTLVMMMMMTMMMMIMMMMMIIMKLNYEDDLIFLQSYTSNVSFSFHHIRLAWLRVRTRMRAEPISPVLMALTMRSLGTIMFTHFKWG